MGEWVSVKDRLPKNHQHVIFKLNEDIAGLGIYCLTGIVKKHSKVCCFLDAWNLEYWRIPTVTHWIPLPELPKEEDS